MRLKTLVEQSLKTSGMSQRAFAEVVGVSHGTINNILAGIQPRNITILQKLADHYHLTIQQLYDDSGGNAVREPEAPYGLAVQRLASLADKLDKDEIDTLERCAEAFLHSTPDVRQHLIGQLKIIERLVRHETAPPDARAGPRQKKTGGH